MYHDLTYLRPLVIQILKDERREWTAQGFGFLRTYFGPDEAPKKFRLNLWDHRFTVPNVSTIHDHPWDFRSVIVAGRFANQRFDMADPFWKEPATHDFTTIRTGVGGGVDKDDKKSCRLLPHNLERYLPGDTYEQKADEIHETHFRNGSITLNERTGDTERARVFWPHGTEWVDAVPRAATRDEVADAVARSMQEWF